MAEPGRRARLSRVLGAVPVRSTAGQRWTAGLALAVAVPVFVYGGAASPTVSASPPPVVGQPPGVAPTPSPGGAAKAPAAASAPSPGPLPAPPASAGGPPSVPTIGPAPVAAPRLPHVVALVRHGRSLPGRDDAAVGAVFLARAQFPVTTVDVGPTAATCRAVVRTGRVALASTGLDGALRDCLTRHGVSVYSFDEAGTVRGEGAVALSSRRGDVASLGDLGRWGLRAHQLDGRVGVVLDSGRAAALAPGVEALRRAGVRVVATAVADSSPAAAAADATSVRAFTLARVSTVVLAAPVAAQRTWVSVAQLLGAGFRYVVSDVDDGIVDEQYPPTFDGALAYTTLRVPWYARDHGATPAQTRCNDVWDAAATPGTTLASEQVDVYAWCQGVQALDQAYLAAALTSESPLALLARLPVDSPLTSPVGPLPGGGYGPRQDAVLVWRATCACWTERTAYRNRDDPTEGLGRLR